MVESFSSKGQPVFPKKRLLVIIENYKFDKVQEYLAEHEETKDKEIKDLNKDHLDKEVARMKKFGEETLKAEVIVLD